MAAFRLAAKACGWLAAYDYDERVLVVWHPVKGRHYSGPLAWFWAAREEGLR